MTVAKTGALRFILITLLIDFTGFGIIIPVVPKLIEQLIGGDLSQASLHGGWLTFAYAFTQFIFAPILGGLSDRFGRRPVLLASLLGLGIDYVFLAFAPDIWWLFIGRIVAGLTGASFSTATAYIADISTPEKRSQNFGLIGAAFGIGFIIGPVIGGIFSKFGPRAPFLVAAALSLLNWIYGYFVLPESLSKENRREFEWKRANPIGSLVQINKLPGALSGLLLSIALLFIANHSSESTWTYFTMEKFQWNEELVGYSLGVVGITIAFVQGFLLRIIIPKLGQKNAAYLGIFVRIFVSILFALSTQGWMMYALLVPFALSFLATPAIQGYVSNHIPANAQGELQGMMGSIMSLTSIVGPVIMTNLFSYFTKSGSILYFPGAPFIMSSCLAVLSGIICVACFRAEKKRITTN
ncbi:transporter, major facilitator family protein [Leptospira inadai serovar Lyme str. 10]|uniref:Transporter, major facilitator family protein n=2 Tax=Leptospira inadai serovar Lyme TaxID=293084 RepID=V6HPJ6_9LEPT|nr:tetracycline resistance MFS efflux pump [Leptospira inadai]EQA38790.1 transporter, major facilitator family protein [Leptospira inadai serovar Lyme str. 10]PNV74090.1 tetracycline resistance MFS efflux pump [Leptospira inadai serovar Lyme]